VTRHLPAELQRPDWNALIMHYLGLDHIGHKTGPQGPAMLPKQREMDGIVRMIYEAMQTEEHLENTLLVLVGDHGMNAGGNHGGSGPGETEPALVFASPKFAGMKSRNCPTTPKAGTELCFKRRQNCYWEMKHGCDHWRGMQSKYWSFSRRAWAKKDGWQL
jgi:ethanolaminephosphotransferase